MTTEAHKPPPHAATTDHAEAGSAPPSPPHDPHFLEFKDSSNVKSARFDEKTGIVEVTFANGSSYKYQNFTAVLMADWASSNSAGKWFHARVKTHPDMYPLVGAPPVAPPVVAPAAPGAAIAEPGSPQNPKAAAAPAARKAAAPVAADAPIGQKRRDIALAEIRKRAKTGHANGSTTAAK